MIDKQKSQIKIGVLAILVALGIGLASAPGVSAAPVMGFAIGEAAGLTSDVSKVPCVWRRVCGRYGCRRVRRCW
jgi:hypothetical protein